MNSFAFLLCECNDKMHKLYMQFVQLKLYNIFAVNSGLITKIFTCSPMTSCALARHTVIFMLLCSTVLHIVSSVQLCYTLYPLFNCVTHSPLCSTVCVTHSPLCSTQGCALACHTVIFMLLCSTVVPSVQLCVLHIVPSVQHRVFTTVLEALGPAFSPSRYADLSTDYVQEVCTYIVYNTTNIRECGSVYNLVLNLLKND